MANRRDAVHHNTVKSWRVDMQLHCRFQTLVWNYIVYNFTATHLDDRSHDSHMTPRHNNPAAPSNPLTVSNPTRDASHPSPFGRERLPCIFSAENLNAIGGPTWLIFQSFQYSIRTCIIKGISDNENPTAQFIVVVHIESHHFVSQTCINIYMMTHIIG